MSISFKADNELITAIRDRAMFNTFAGNQSYVIKGIGDELKVTITPSTFNVSLGSGEAVICGGSTIIDSGNSLTLGANESGYLVIRVDLSQSQENICQFISVPTLIQQNINNGDDLIYDLPLYQYTTSVSAVSSLVDKRDIRDHVMTNLDGGNTGQILSKKTSTNGDFAWISTDYMEVDTLGTYQSATPINADLLEGHNASYFQQKLTAGTGIAISNNTISNVFSNLPAGTDLNNITYNYQGYVNSGASNTPTNTGGSLLVLASNDGKNVYQLFSQYNTTATYIRKLQGGTWRDWVLVATKIQITTILHISEVPTTFTSYDCNWQDYDLLNIVSCQYANYRSNILIPVSQFIGTSTGRRPIVTDVLTTSSLITYQVYQNGEGSVYVQGSLDPTTYRILHIDGIKLGG